MLQATSPCALHAEQTWVYCDALKVYICCLPVEETSCGRVLSHTSDVKVMRRGAPEDTQRLPFLIIVVQADRTVASSTDQNIFLMFFSEGRPLITLFVAPRLPGGSRILSHASVG